ncbi:hypothetical protein AQUCO_00600479v1 [Aquilegia coerulea]|uniref:Remorin C-terminal domain-containing protein n=1 Tax=Aquilegia coerulea TaxID=218851 RepID=A0A2G5EPU0_AQUCA|nr:hypothetical protein AQUCO_00600479v1 [Aquilegia coerulea]
MESLAKQMRVRFSGLGQDNQEGPNSVKERKLPPQQTQSFKGGKKSQNWLRRQFSGEMSQESDLGVNNEFAIAIAAAASAIKSLEEESKPPRKLSDDPEASLTKSLSRKEDSTIGRVSRRFSGKEINVGEASMRKPEVADQIMPVSWTDDQKTPKRTSSMRKTPTFADTRPIAYDTLSTAGGGKQEKAKTSWVGGTKADVWENAEMTKVKKRYERMTSTILSWEKEKKAKAKRRKEKIESDLEKRRARALQTYHNDMSRIDQIAGGARAVAEERRRDDESKIREKANKIRSTGKRPVTCFCF